MDERRTLSLLGWTIGSVVAAVFVLKRYRFVTHLNVLERCAGNDVAAKSYVLCRVIWHLKQQNKRRTAFLGYGDTLLFLSIEERGTVST